MFIKLVNVKYLQRSINFDAFKFSTAAAVSPKKVAVAKSNDKPKKERVNSKELLNYIESQKCHYDIQALASPHLLKIRRSIPECLYVTSKDTAKTIATILVDKLKGNIPVLEINPGFGCLTTELLQCGISNLRVCEYSVFHKAPLLKLKEKYPNLRILIGDFLGLWKLEFQDKMDGGNRVETFFNDIHKNSNDVSLKVVGAMPSLNFIRYLINSLIFQKGIIEMGRPELFITLPPASYYNLIPFNTEEEHRIYRYIPVLFNVLCDIELMTKLPRRNFLPWESESTQYKKVKKEKIKDYDQEYVYLVRIKLKKDLPCRADDLPLLWYFFKHHLMSKSNRVIPMLEQWIPGCGVWLITGQDPPGTNVNTLPGEKDAPLPHITIFTQFFELTPAEKVTIFKKFISWPEFKHCPFQEAMENHISKTLSTGVDIKDDLDQDESNEL